MEVKVKFPLSQARFFRGPAELISLARRVDYMAKIWVEGTLVHPEDILSIPGCDEKTTVSVNIGGKSIKRISASVIEEIIILP